MVELATSHKIWWTSI